MIELHTNLTELPEHRAFLWTRWQLTKIAFQLSGRLVRSGAVHWLRHHSSPITWGRGGLVDVVVSP